MCRKLVNHFLFAALLLHSSPPAKEWCCPNNLGSTSGCSVSPSVGVPSWLQGAACWGTHGGLCAGAGMGTGLEGAGQASVPTQPCPVLQTCTRGGGTTPWRRWLEEAPFDAVDNKWLEGRGSLQFLSGLTWHVDAHCSPVQGTSAVLTATQRLLKLSQECHNGNSKGLSL